MVGEPGDEWGRCPGLQGTGGPKTQRHSCSLSMPSPVHGLKVFGSNYGVRYGVIDSLFRGLQSRLGEKSSRPALIQPGDV
jgi:hypothetical protein